MTENELATIAVDICYKIHTTRDLVCLKVCMRLLLHTNWIKGEYLTPVSKAS